MIINNKVSFQVLFSTKQTCNANMEMWSMLSHCIQLKENFIFGLDFLRYCELYLNTSVCRFERRYVFMVKSILIAGGIG